MKRLLTFLLICSCALQLDGCRLPSARQQRESLLKRAHITKETESLRHNADYLAAEKAYHAGQYEKALKLYQVVLEKDPAIPEAHRILIRCYYKLGRINAAVSHYKRYVLDHLQSAEGHYALGVAYTYVDDAKSEDCYMQALRLKPDFAQPMSNLGSIYLGRGQVQRALRMYRKAIRHKPDFAPAYYNIGTVMRDQYNFSEAEAFFKKAIELNPQYGKAMAELALLYVNNSLPEKAVPVADRASRLPLEEERTGYALGQTYNALGRPDLARKILMAAIKEFPEEATLYSELSQTQLMLGKPEEAVAVKRKAVHHDPQSGLAHYSLGVTLREQGRVDEAMNEYRKSIALDPNYPPARLNLGLLYYEAGDYDNAEVMLRKALELQPNFPLAHLHMGNVHKDLQRYGDAIREFDIALDESPRFDEAYLRRGQAYAWSGEIEKAQQDFSQAINLNPQMLEARYERACTHFVLHEGFDARQDAGALAGLVDDYDFVTNRAIIVGYFGALQAQDTLAAAQLLKTARMITSKIDWPFQGIRYLRGELNEQELLAKPQDLKEQTEAHLWIALKLRYKTHGSVEQIRSHLLWVKNQRKLRETPAVIADFELKHLKPQSETHHLQT